MTRFSISMLAVASSVIVACGGAPEPPKATSSTPGVGEPSSAAPDLKSPAPTAPTEQPPPAAAPAEKPAAAPSFALGETPDAKLGTLAPGYGIAVGQKAPDATLDDVSGKKQKLSDLYKAGPTFVVFYRGGWCPFCNIQLHDLGAAKADFDKRGVKIVAISVDKPSEEAKTQAKDGVPFPMLSDPKLVALKGFKVVHVAGEEEAKKMAGFGVDLASYSGETHKSYAVPAVYLVDKTGVVRFAHVDEDYKTRPSVKQLLGVADKLATK